MKNPEEISLFPFSRFRDRTDVKTDPAAGKRSETRLFFTETFLLRLRYLFFIPQSIYPLSLSLLHVQSFLFSIRINGGTLARRNLGEAKQSARLYVPEAAIVYLCLAQKAFLSLVLAVRCGTRPRWTPNRHRSRYNHHQGYTQRNGAGKKPSPGVFGELS